MGQIANAKKNPEYENNLSLLANWCAITLWPMNLEESQSERGSHFARNNIMLNGANF